MQTAQWVVVGALVVLTIPAARGLTTLTRCHIDHKRKRERMVAFVSGAAVIAIVEVLLARWMGKQWAFVFFLATCTCWNLVVDYVLYGAPDRKEVEVGPV